MLLEHTTVELKDNQKLDCPACKSWNTEIIEAFRDRSHQERWFYHHCLACDWSNALSNGFIVEDDEGNLIAQCD